MFRLFSLFVLTAALFSVRFPSTNTTASESVTLCRCPTTRTSWVSWAYLSTYPSSMLMQVRFTPTGCWFAFAYTWPSLSSTSAPGMTCSNRNSRALGSSSESSATRSMRFGMINVNGISLTTSYPFAPVKCSSHSARNCSAAGRCTSGSASSRSRAPKSGRMALPT
uniref:(northern house mosquito) hypothetical protein n=1 Tax=Culex pipiens TaxID=7175 RepID=A0A8D8GKQ0_CULPI